VSNSTTITCRYKGESATVKLRWKETPFLCVAKYAGSSKVLGAFTTLFETSPGYHIKPPSVFNAETYLNAAHAASARFDGFTYTIEPPLNIGDYLRPADKDPKKVY
jgi:hypothetical protein